MTALKQLTDDELLVLAQECRGELHGDHHARSYERDIEAEVRRRFAGATTVAALLDIDVHRAATQSRWRELLGHAATTYRRVSGR